MVLKHVQEIKDHMHYYMHICKLLHRNIYILYRNVSPDEISEAFGCKVYR